MKILKVDPGEPPKISDMDGRLETMQNLVGGLIQALYPFEDRVALICNDEGKLMGMGLPPNRALRDPESGEIYDIVCGPMFLCGVSAGSNSFTDLTQEQLTYYENYYKTPEVFLKTGLGIVVLNV